MNVFYILSDNSLDYFTLRYFPHLYIVRDCAHMVGGSS